MATQCLIVSLLLPFVLLFVSSNGRPLQKNDMIGLLRSSFSNNVTMGAVSLATSSSYTGKTNYNDVLGLVALCTQYTWLEEENEDPCISPKWSWIQCNSDANPRITELDLSSRILFGLLPDFSSMDALQKIDVSLNSLSGPIPSFLGTFPDLQELNLAYNLFTGLVPDSLSCNKNLKLSTNGNSNLYTSGSCSKSNSPPSSTANRNTANTGRSFGAPATATKGNNLPVILGSTISLLVVFWIVIGIFVIFRHRAKTAAAIAEASAPGTKVNNIPAEEMPMTTAHSNDMSP